MSLDSIEHYVSHLDTSEKIVADYLISEYVINNKMPFDAIYELVRYNNFENEMAKESMDFLGEREQGRVLEAFGKYMINEF